MDSNKKIEELEKRVAALEKPISFSPEYIQALLNTGFTRVKKGALLTAASNRDYFYLFFEIGKQVLSSDINQIVLAGEPYYYYVPIKSVDVSGNWIYSSQGDGVGGNYPDGTQITFLTSGLLPAPLSTTISYYVRDSDPSNNRFKVSTTFGGTAVNITDTGEGEAYYTYYT
jgi:hypothetical protein